MFFGIDLKLLLIALAIVIALGFFVIRLREKKSDHVISNVSASQNESNLANYQQQNIVKKLTPEELLDKAWEFLSVIAEKVLKMASSTQNDILDIGRKMKARGMVFTIMVDDGNSKLPKSPAKEKAAQEQRNAKLAQHSQ